MVLASNIQHPALGCNARLLFLNAIGEKIDFELLSHAFQSFAQDAQDPTLRKWVVDQLENQLPQLHLDQAKLIDDMLADADLFRKALIKILNTYFA
ncbi:MAG: hypothetical protein AB7F64_10260, partial [Gammaproteobacteria bacterium]